MKNKKSIYIFVSLMLVLIFSFFMDYLAVFQSMIYDHMYESADTPSDNIVIVGIDDLSYENIGRWPYSRDMQSVIFQNILRDHPAVLGIDIIYDAITNTADDQMLIDTLQNNPVVCASVLVSGKEQWGYVSENQYLTPFSALDDAVTTGYINAYTEEKDNGVIRQAILSRTFDDTLYDSFAYAIYQKYALHNGIQEDNFSDEYNHPLYVDYAGQPTDFQNISAYMVYNDMIPEGFFEDKIVLFGPYSLGMQDEYPTPIDKEEKMFGVEVHANIIQNLMENRFKRDVSGYVDLFLIFFTGLLSFVVSRKAKPFLAFWLHLCLIIAYFGAGKYVYTHGYVLQIVYPIATVLVFYIVTLVYNYIEQTAERKRITGIFGRYVAPQIVNKILEDGDANLKLGGTRKYISVLFVDIRGFTPLSEKAQPEEVVEILNAYLDLCAKSIFHNGGTLDKFIGDATMAIYNAPLDLEDHAFCAVKTAWEMKKGAQSLMKDLEEKYNRTVQFGIGVNTGYAVVGNIGSNDRMDYTAIGDTVNTSARLESNAKPGQILISQETYDLVKDKITATSLGGLKVKGKSEEIAVYQVDDLQV